MKNEKNDDMTVDINKSTLNNVLIIVLAVVAFLVGGYWIKSKNAGEPIKFGVDNSGSENSLVQTTIEELKIDPVTEDDHIRGNKNAEIALVEYSDLQCPFCKSFHTTAQNLLDTYGEDLMWVYRHFPLESIHEKANKEAQATECAYLQGGDEAFWTMVDSIFENSPSITLDDLPNIAENVGLDVEAFNSCLETGDTEELVTTSINKALRAGINSTPTTFLVNVKTGNAVALKTASFSPELVEQAVNILKEN